MEDLPVASVEDLLVSLASPQHLIQIQLIEKTGNWRVSLNHPGPPYLYGSAAAPTIAEAIEAARRQMLQPKVVPRRPSPPQPQPRPASLSLADLGLG